jgi:hypothetical protein
METGPFGFPAPWTPYVGFGSFRRPRVQIVFSPEVSVDPGAEVGLKSFFGPKLEELAAAIDKASDASERHARALVRATWVLAAATLILAIATLASLMRP